MRGHDVDDDHEARATDRRPRGCSMTGDDPRVEVWAQAIYDAVLGDGPHPNYDFNNAARAALALADAARDEAAEVSYEKGVRDTIEAQAAGIDVARLLASEASARAGFHSDFFVALRQAAREAAPTGGTATDDSTTNR